MSLSQTVTVIAKQLPPPPARLRSIAEGHRVCPVIVFRAVHRRASERQAAIVVTGVCLRALPVRRQFARGRPSAARHAAVKESTPRRVTQ